MSQTSLTMKLARRAVEQAGLAYVEENRDGTYTVWARSSPSSSAAWSIVDSDMLDEARAVAAFLTIHDPARDAAINASALNMKPAL